MGLQNDKEEFDRKGQGQVQNHFDFDPPSLHVLDAKRNLSLKIR